MKKIRFTGIRRFFKGRGFAAALVLSITAVGASAYIAYNGAVNRLQRDDPNAQAVEKHQDGVPMDTTPQEASNQTPPENGNLPGLTPTPGGEPTDIEEANRFVRPGSPKVLPVEGDIINQFSNGELVKSNTLGVWRTHDAVDIAAPLGSEVKAIQRGTVTEIYSNAMWGICVTIDHGDGVLSNYMGLDKNVKVEQGQEVQAGDVIALIGNTAEAEIADPPHLHFAVKRDDAWIDPIGYINE